MSLLINRYNSFPLSQSPSSSPSIPIATPILQAQQPQYKIFIIHKYEKEKINISNSFNVQIKYFICNLFFYIHKSIPYKQIHWVVSLIVLVSDSLE